MLCRRAATPLFSLAGLHSGFVFSSGQAAARSAAFSCSGREPWRGGAHAGFCFAARQADPRPNGFVRPQSPAELSRSQLSISSSRLYFASRSERVTEPTLICPAPDATARSARNESSVSPERAEITAPYPASRALSITVNVSVIVPI